MSITTPYLGSYRPPFNGFDSLNSNSSSATARTGNSAPASTATVDLAPVTKAPSSFNSDTVASNILSFVQRRLTQAAQQGASTDQLAALLAQARKGAASGFDQAVAELKSNGSLDDSLSSGISSALQKVDKGFDALAKQFGIATDTATAPSAATKPAPTAQTNSLNQLAASYRASFSSKQSVDLVVKTADGDIVHLQLGVKDKQSVSANYQANANGQQLNIASSEKSSARLSISVDGNLDAGELQALSDLLGKVGDLADKFFGGDVTGAFQEASTLDFSNPELSSLSLDLRSEVSIREKVGAYQQIQGLGSGAGNNSSVGGNNINGNNSVAAPSTSTLSDLASALSSLLPQASTAANPAGLLKQLLAAQIGATNAGATDQQANPLLDFANRLLTALGADKASADTASVIDSATVAPSNKTTAGAAAAAS